MTPGRRAIPLLLLAALACDRPSAEKIEQWKGTVKGPGKLEAALRDPAVAPELRARAAVALGEIGRGAQVEAALEELPPPSRGPLVSALVALHGAAVATAEGAALASARDGLFQVRAHADPGERVEIDRLLLQAVTRQLGAPGAAAGKLIGSQSLDRIVEALGAPAAAALIPLLRQPGSNPVELATLIDKVAEPAQREDASATLVELARARRSLDAAFWQALGTLGGSAARRYLVEVARGREVGAAVSAAQALQLRPVGTPGGPTGARELLEPALELVADPDRHGNLREALFGLLEVCCGAEAVPGLLRVIAGESQGAGKPLARGKARPSGERERMVRYRAYSAALVAGGAGAIVPALSAFPAQMSHAAADVRDFLVRDVERLGARKGERARVIEALLAGLEAASPLTRLVCVLALEKLGDATAVAPLRARGGDGTRLRDPGFGSVGEEARRVAELLQRR